MQYLVESVEKSDYQEIVEVWEASVKATHLFLKEEDIGYFKLLILNKYLDVVELRCIRNHKKKIVGFLGVADQNIEMLFVHPGYFGKGIGKALIVYSVAQLGVKKVDVNEQNLAAVGFYQNNGFETVSRSAVDSAGKPYPILHMELKLRVSAQMG